MSTENEPKPENLQPPAPPETSAHETELTEAQLDQVNGGGTPNPWKLWGTMHP